MDLIMQTMTDLEEENRAMWHIPPRSTYVGQRFGPMTVSVKSTYDFRVSPRAKATAYLIRSGQAVREGRIIFGDPGEHTTTSIHSTAEIPTDSSLLGEASVTWSTFHWDHLPAPRRPGVYVMIILFKLDGHNIDSYVQSSTIEVHRPARDYTRARPFTELRPEAENESTSDSN